MPQKKIFLSYSQKDQNLFNAFLTHLSSFERDGAILVWTDKNILPGDDWDRKIHDMMSDADAAVVLVSPDALASDYIVEKEIRYLVAPTCCSLSELCRRMSSHSCFQWDSGGIPPGRRASRP